MSWFGLSADDGSEAAAEAKEARAEARASFARRHRRRRLRQFMMLLVALPVVVLLATLFHGTSPRDGNGPGDEPYQEREAKVAQRYAQEYQAMRPVVDEVDDWVYSARSLEVIEAGDPRRWGEANGGFGDSRLVAAQVEVEPGPRVRPGDAPPAHRWQVFVNPQRSSTSAFATTGAMSSRCPPAIDPEGHSRAAGGDATPGRIPAEQGVRWACWLLARQEAPDTVVLGLVEPDLDLTPEGGEPLRLAPGAIKFLLQVRPSVASSATPASAAPSAPATAAPSAPASQADSALAVDPSRAATGAASRD